MKYWQSVKLNAERLYNELIKQDLVHDLADLEDYMSK